MKATVNPQKEFRPVTRLTYSDEGLEILNLKIHRSTLERLLRTRQLYLEELSSADSQTAGTLKNLLRQCIQSKC
ncbi:hypothetical protein [Bowmanella dokdonensis]|uniref:Uncharacterized protein n=1 Tax=Bowmanella dokdonensis TaxID=751969 RepID=A0A939DNM1_9ALTE|nr:hypothetical protein [Bowmanella dokdonensis]MBN7825833.1 hypothetical protein [Bowmanella dokdonensis]